MRSNFDAQLSTLHQELIRMGALCEEVIGLAAEALTKEDPKITNRIPALDTEIDHMEREIENLCLRLLLQQQPVARDLRQVSAALKMITDMERIGDQASDIREIIGFLGTPPWAECAPIERMASAASRMVTSSVDAFVQQNVAMAEATIAMDDTVDDLFRQVKQSLISSIAENPAGGEYALDMLMIAKYFERIGDHATNIAEWVVFAVTGVHNEHEGEE